MARTTKVNPAQVEKFLRGLDYPVSKEELVRAADAQGADERIIELLRRLPLDSFNAPTDITEAIGRIV